MFQDLSEILGPLLLPSPLGNQNQHEGRCSGSRACYSSSRLPPPLGLLTTAENMRWKILEMRPNSDWRSPVCPIKFLSDLLPTLQSPCAVFTLQPSEPEGPRFSVTNLRAMQEMRVWPLGWEDLLGKEMVTHSSLPAWEIPWTEEPGELQSVRLRRVRQDLATKSAATQDPGFVVFTPSTQV